MISWLKLIGLTSSLVFVLSACSGGSSDSGTTGEDDDNPEDSPEMQTTASFTTLPADDQPNTLSPDIVEDSTGNYHAIYSDIDGRLFYAHCGGDCNSTSSWRHVELSTFELESITGAVTAKLLLDSSEQLHIAVAVNSGGGGILSNQPIYYGLCASLCIDADSWSIGQVAGLTRSVLEREAQTTDWFALTTTGNPRFTFIEPESTFGDEFLWYFSCDTDCTQDSNWTRSAVTELNLASSAPAHMLIGSDNIPQIIFPYQIIGASSTRLMYATCQSACETSAPVWSDSLELIQYESELSSDHAVSVTQLNDNPIVAVYHTVDEQVEISLLDCESNCENAAEWQQNIINGSLPYPSSVASLSPVIDLMSDNGVLHLGLIGKDRSVNSVNRIMRFTCDGDCSTNQWTYETLADTSTITFDNQGICLFIGTAAREPLKLLPTAFSFEAVPQWACSTAPVEITDSDGNVYIDYNSDIRFFEIASFGTAD